RQPDYDSVNWARFALRLCTKKFFERPNSWPSGEAQNAESYLTFSLVRAGDSARSTCQNAPADAISAGASQQRSVLKKRCDEGRERGHEHADDDRVGAGRADELHHAADRSTVTYVHRRHLRPDNRNLAEAFRAVPLNERKAVRRVHKYNG